MSPRGQVFVWIGLSLFSAFSPFGLADTLPIVPGYYVGTGNGATTVLRVLPGRAAVLSSIPSYARVTPEAIRDSSRVSAGAFVGKIKSKGSGLVLAFSAIPKIGLPSCQYGLKLEKTGLCLTYKTKGCEFYRGDTWGFGSGQDSVLRKIKR